MHIGGQTQLVWGGGHISTLKKKKKRLTGVKEIEVRTFEYLGLYLGVQKKYYGQ
jgi:hypothetical protein